ncbi:MAG: CBASS oligonucleotide cyclase [Hyphomicrobiales bacterium]
MRLNNNTLLNYVENIKFSTEEKRKYQNQIDNLIKEISNAIKNNTNTKVLKVIQSGSWKKGTILKKSINNPIDIDLVFYLDIDFYNNNTFQEINSEIKKLLKTIYPTKDNSDFWESAKTAGIEFKTSGLNVDIIPVKQNHYDCEYVEQPTKDHTTFITSPKLQLKFISERKEENPSYSSIVRLLKKWKNYNGLKLSSFAIELIVASLDKSKGVETNIEEAILRFFKLISSKYFPKIRFHLYGNETYDNSIIYIADPSNDNNNVTKYLSEKEWNIVKNYADKAFDTLIYSDQMDYNSQTEPLWKEIFGDDFKIKN